MSATSNRTPSPSEQLTPAQIEAMRRRLLELEAGAAEVQAEKNKIEAEKNKIEAEKNKIEAEKERLAEEAAQLEAKRAASTQEVENEPGTIADEKRQADQSDRLLREQTPYVINIPIDQRQIDPKHPDRIQTETFQINGGGKYVVERGEDQEVPESIYLLAVQSGLVRPQRPEHAIYYPRVSVKPGKAAGII